MSPDTTRQPQQAPGLRARLNRSEILVAPGVYDGLTAALAQQALKASAASGAGKAAKRLVRS